MPHFYFVGRPMYVLYFCIYFMLMDNIVISSIYVFGGYSLLFLIGNITFGSNFINKLSAHVSYIAYSPGSALHFVSW